MRILNRLNGWQRLWLVLTILYGLAVTAMTTVILPKESDIRSSWAWDAMRVAVDDIKRVRKYDGTTWDFRDAFFKDKTDEEVVRSLTDGARSIDLADSKTADLADYKSNILTLENKYQKQIKDLPREQLKATGMAFLAWMIPALAIYVLGYTAGWIYSGFKEGPT
jgi:hypothetical protein